VIAGRRSGFAWRGRLGWTKELGLQLAFEPKAPHQRQGRVLQCRHGLVPFISPKMHHDGARLQGIELEVLSLSQWAVLFPVN